MKADHTGRATWFIGAMVVLAAATQLNAQRGWSSERFSLKDGKSLTLKTTEAWDGQSTHVGLDFVLTELSGASTTIHRQHLFRTQSNLGSLAYDGVYPSVRSALETEHELSILVRVMPMGITEDGHYLLLKKTGNSFQVMNSLALWELWPSQAAMDSKQPRELQLTGMRRIHIVHHDQFDVKIDIAPDNSVTINGKPCAPANAPIKRLHYRQFLHALSPNTEQTYEVPLQEPRDISWWANPSITPPLSHDDYQKFSRVIEWASPPRIDRATIPPELLGGEQSVAPAPVRDKFPGASLNPMLTKAPEETHAVRTPSEEPPSSRPWSIILVLIVATTGVLWLLVKRH